jgi:predicted amidohydrolase
MARALPVAVVQQPPIPVTESIDRFAHDVWRVLAQFRQTRMVIYPELHLFGVDAVGQLRTAAKPLDAPGSRRWPSWPATWACGGWGVGRSVITDPEGRVRVADDPGPTVLTDVLELDEVGRVRRFDTAGLNRMWEQFTAADPRLELPVYSGRIDPTRWKPRDAP